MKRNRILALGAVITVLGFAAAPVLSSSSDGSLTLTGAGDNTPIASGTVPVTWDWSAGDRVRSSSDLAVQYSNGMGVGGYVEKKRVSIRNGQTTWDTTQIPDGVYTVRALVWNAKHVNSVLGPVIVDNTAPEARITDPAPGSVIVDDRVITFTPVVAGVATLKASVSDNLSGIAEVRWYLDGQDITDDVERIDEVGAHVAFDFNTVEPGPHTLTVQAWDRAGNFCDDPEECSVLSTDSVDIVSTFGPSMLGGIELPDPEDLPGLPDEGEPCDPEVQECEPDPTLPDLPDLPDPEDLPGLPDPEDLPGLPDPSDPQLPELPGLPGDGDEDPDDPDGTGNLPALPNPGDLQPPVPLG